MLLIEKIYWHLTLSAEHHFYCGVGSGVFRLSLMENDKNYYQGILKVIDYLLNVNKLLKREEGIRLTGNYWNPILDVFRDNSGTYIMSYEIIGRKDNIQPLLALREQCLNRIKEIDKAESDRNIDRKYKIKGILYGKLSLIISILAFVFSIFSYCNRPEFSQKVEDSGHEDSKRGYNDSRDSTSVVFLYHAHDVTVCDFLVLFHLL